MLRLFLHEKFAGTGTNATIRGGEFMETEFSTIAQARRAAKSILAMDPSVGRITIHRGTTVEDTVTR